MKKKVYFKKLKQLTPSKDLYKSKNIKIDNINYDIYIDKKTNIKLFKPTPTFNDLKKLNLFFNNQNEYVNIGINKDNNLYKRIVKIGKKAVVVALALNVVLGSAEIVHAETIDNQNEEIISIYDIESSLTESLFFENYDYEIVEEKIENIEILSEKELNEKRESISQIVTKALEENKKLTDKEKTYFYKLIPILEDNIEYVDLNHIYETYKNIYFLYDKEKNGNTGACYYFLDNYIIFYNAKNINEVQESYITHELCHTFDKSKTNDHQFFTEAINVLFNNEYFDNSNTYEYDESYCTLINYLLALKEIIGIEPIKEYQFNHNEDIIINALYDIIPIYDMAICLMYYLDTEYLLYTGESDLNFIESYNHSKELETIINNYYKEKKGFSYENDLLLNIFIDGTLDYNIASRLCGFDVDNWRLNKYGYYINKSKLNEQFTLEFTLKDGNIMVPLNNENRYIENLNITRQ